MSLFLNPASSQTSILFSVNPFMPTFLPFLSHLPFPCHISCLFFPPILSSLSFLSFLSHLRFPPYLSCIFFSDYSFLLIFSAFSFTFKYFLPTFLAHFSAYPVLPTVPAFSFPPAHFLPTSWSPRPPEKRFSLFSNYIGHPPSPDGFDRSLLLILPKE